MTNRVTSPTRRKLPEDPQTLDKALAPWRVLAKPVINGYNKALDVAFEDPLNSDEIDSGLQAASALLYQRGGEISGEALCLLFIAGTLLPRGAKYLADRRKAEKEASTKVVIPTIPRTQTGT